jgi:8-oxo-dGTP pyrophosphatase MutT (NUDIX family)
MQPQGSSKLFLETAEFEILAAGSFRSGDIVTRFTPDPASPRSPEDNASIERTWRERVAECQESGVSLYDGALFRLLKYDFVEGRLVLEFGNTSYREYVGTRTPSYSATHGRSDLANPMAVCAVVRTSDGKILLDRRVGTDVYAGRYHVIGGFADRDNDLQTSAFNPFDAIAREVREETGLDTSPHSFICTGLAYDVLTPHPELCFLTHAADSHQAEEALKNGDKEIHALEFLEDSAESLGNFLRQNHGKISATGEASLLLYGLHSYGESWFAEQRTFMR